MTKIYITKHALTSGIIATDGEILGRRVRVGDYKYYHGEGREWHTTLESAVAKANEMRKAKLASLEKQKCRLIKMDFSKEHLHLLLEKTYGSMH